MKLAVLQHTGILTVLSTFFVLLPFFALAHGSGATIEKSVGEYLVDIGYTPEVLQTGEQARIDFLLYDLEAGNEIEFTDIWLRIEKEEKLLFAGGIAQPKFGSAGVSYTFFESGEYSVFVRYQLDGESLVETTVAIPVEQGEVSTSNGAYSGTALAFVSLLTFILTSALIIGVASLRSGFKKVMSMFADVPKLRLVHVHLLKLYRGRVKTDPLKSSESGIQSKLLEIGLNLVVGIFVAYVTYVTTQYFLQNGFTFPDFVSDESAETINVETSQKSIYITLTEEGYEPSEVTIEKGTKVTFLNETKNPHWPASNLHPSHAIFPEFDPQKPVPKDESWSFVFNKVGSWKFHDHIRSYYTGVIHVTE